MMTGIKLIAVLIIIGAFAFVILFTLRRESRTRAEKLARAKELGFQPLDQVPSSIQERIDWLHKHRSNQEIEIRNLATLKRSEYSIFLFDLIDIGGEDVSPLQYDTFLVVSSELSLPRFTIVPRILQKGILAEWVNKAVQELINRSGEQVVKTNDPRFNETFLLFGEHHQQVAPFFARVSSSSLVDHKYALLEGGGDSFTYGGLPIPSQGDSNSQSLREQLHEVEHWFRIFRDARV